MKKKIYIYLFEINVPFKQMNSLGPECIPMRVYQKNAYLHTDVEDVCIPVQNIGPALYLPRYHSYPIIVIVRNYY